MLKANGIKISMDGRGRAFDNISVERLWRTVKYEDVYLKGYATMGELMIGLSEYIAFYNGERPHRGLNDQPPDVVYRRGTGGGALIIDTYARAEAVSCASLRSPQDTASAANTATSKQASGQRCSAASHVECGT